MPCIINIPFFVSPWTVCSRSWRESAYISVSIYPLCSIFRLNVLSIFFSRQCAWDCFVSLLLCVVVRELFCANESRVVCKLRRLCRNLANIGFLTNASSQLLVSFLPCCSFLHDFVVNILFCCWIHARRYVWLQSKLTNLHPLISWQPIDQPIAFYLLLVVSREKCICILLFCNLLVSLSLCVVVWKRLVRSQVARVIY